MRILPILAMLAVGSVAVAQQDIEIYPGQTSFTSRGNVGSGTGEVHQGFHAGYWRSIGDDGSACTINQWFGVIQDQNAATQENYYLVWRRGDDTNGPGITSADVISRVGPYNSPAGTGTAAWIVTSAVLTPPVTLPDCQENPVSGYKGMFSIGMEFTAAPLWTADGVSLHTSFGSSTTPHQYSHGAQEDHAWMYLGPPATAMAHPSDLRSWRLGQKVSQGALQMCNGVAAAANDRCGMGGLFPLNGPGTEFSARARYPIGLSGGTSLLWVSVNRLLPIIGGFKLFPGTARLHLTGPVLYQLSSASINSSGNFSQANHALASPLPGLGVFTAYFQAVGFNTSQIVMTNTTSTTFQ
ncbi:MAG: hypothetical protein H6837_05400 [Planctomycetes bacterium]|nr:hypothetical protein [Planctomycetota bacterium]